MQTALYDPEDGYYTRRQQIGGRGDFYTNANIHPLFGVLLAEKLVVLLNGLPDSSEPMFIEVGAGTGLLAEHVLRHLEREHHEWFERITYVMVEASPAMKQVEQERLQHMPNITWKSFDEFEAGTVTGIIFSNELIDAMPVHRLQWRNGRFHELYVDWRDGRWIWVAGPCSCQEVEAFVMNWSLGLDEGQVIEVNLNALRYLELIARLLKHGYLLTIDYGDRRERLFSAARREGTVRSFYRHVLIDDVLERIGDQDITASVDFTTLIEHGERVGLRLVEFKTQRQFLLEQGLMERLAAMRESGGAGVEFYQSLLAAKHLLMPGALGDHFKVLIQQKACD
ncbi:MAG: SAM-dependent methyltransferase [Acidobacteriota bacterium]|nr:SAM-dependent methyltransferase [Blastocatellia bacterium]MDW8241058.1 SAM-dependent methyltransferase [Acidobacteriota bacterium]